MNGIKKLIQNAGQINYTVYSDNAPHGKKHYQLNFQPLCEFYDIKPKEPWFILHYNKFEKKWGLVRGKDLTYSLINEPKLAIPQIPVLLLLPDDRFPEALIRGVLLYDDLPKNTNTIPPPILHKEDIAQIDKYNNTDVILSDSVEFTRAET